MATHEIQSPMTGNVVEVSVSVGDQISEGDLIIVIESMKMENEIFSEVSGTVTEVRVEEDENVSEEAVIIVVEN
ncbi:MAG: acetyl-CoA carboxylase biotin carboxyl carrier protein subunit [Dehalococcoidia bacterium]